MYIVFSRNGACWWAAACAPAGATRKRWLSSRRWTLASRTTCSVSRAMICYLLFIYRMSIRITAKQCEKKFFDFFCSNLRLSLIVFLSFWINTTFIKAFYSKSIVKGVKYKVSIWDTTWVINKLPKWTGKSNSRNIRNSRTVVTDISAAASIYIISNMSVESRHYRGCALERGFSYIILYIFYGSPTYILSTFLLKLCSSLVASCYWLKDRRASDPVDVSFINFNLPYPKKKKV